MIQVNRLPEPKFFKSFKLLELKKSMESLFADSNRQHRLHFDSSILQPVMDDLIHQFHNKCAYCETYLGKNTPAYIDNFRPKSGARDFDNNFSPDHYWWLAYEWENLMLSCQMCDQKFKREWFPIENNTVRAAIGATGAELLKERALLIDPCQENPEDHLNFGLDGIAINLTKKGKVTIDILGLNRQDLVDNRKRTITKLFGRLEALTIGNKSAQNDRDKLYKYIKELFSESPSQEYVANQRVVFKTWHEENFTIWKEIENSQLRLAGSSNKFWDLYSGLKGNPDISNAIFFSRLSTARSKTSESTEQQSNLKDLKKLEKQLSIIKRFSIKTIEIKNFRCISNLTLHVLPVSEQQPRESWLLLLGDNGIGKSTILQAITLALSGKKLIDRFGFNPNEFISRGETKGYIKIQSYEHNEPVELYFSSSGFKTTLEEPPTFILAYGSTRLLPKGNLKSENNKHKVANIRNLFDYSVALNDVNKWLRLVDEDEFHHRIAPALFDLLALKDNDKILINDGQLFIEQQSEKYTVEEISDGYKSIVALASDIMQTLSIDNSSYHTTQGIVLIDELGNHLHPRWRMKIVDALRKAFPKLQFIVTTHEPLCLRGLSHGEVNVLVRDQNHKLQVLDKNLLPDHNLLRIDQLLTSDLFGLINTLDFETEKTYEEYYNLLSKPNEERTKEEQDRIVHFTKYLSKMEMLGSNPQIQALYQIINEKFAQELRSEGFKTKQEIKEVTIEQVKGMIDSDNLKLL